MALQPVVIKVDLCIECNHLAAFGQSQRIDLHHRTVERDEELIKVTEQLGSSLELVPSETELPSQFQALEWLQTEQGMYLLADDSFRMLLGSRFNVDSTFGTCDNQRRSRRPIDKNRHLEFSLKYHRVDNR